MMSARAARRAGGRGAGPGPARAAGLSLDWACVAVSVGTILADLATDLIVLVENWQQNHIHWATATLLLVLPPNVIVQVFSLRWHVADGTATVQHWLSHAGMAGIFHRYISLIKSMFRSQEDVQAVQKFHCDLSDLNMLNLFRSLLESAPQIALQCYCFITSEEYSVVRATSLSVSILSLLWSGFIYSHGAILFHTVKPVRWPSFVLKSAWYFSMLVARLAAIVLFTVVFGVWTLVPLGIHWAAMTLWIISQKTEFCPSKLEEFLYNTVLGFIYCFCYFNLREGRTRYRLMTFYTLMVTQNLASLFLFMLVSDIDGQRKVWAILATVCIIAGTVLGLCCMLLYYRWFHPKGPIKWKNIVDDDIELNNKDSFAHGTSQLAEPHTAASTCVRTLKTGTSKPRFDIVSAPASQEVTLSPQPEIENTDKKFLLDHWIARAGTPTFMSAPIGNNSMEASSIELHTVENTPQSVSIILQTDNAKILKKKIGICSPTELNLKLSSIENIESSIDELTASNLTLQKRRGICSSDELNDDLQQLDIEDRKGEKSQKSVDHGSEISQDTDSSNKKTSSDSIDMDLDLSFSDINSSDINEFNENIVQKLCLSTLKNIKVGNQDADIQNIQRIALDILKEMYTKKGKHKKVHKDVLNGSKRDLDTPTEVLSVHDYENICAVNIAREAWGLRSWNGYSDIENWMHDGSVVRDRRRDTLTSASSEISSCISQELRSYILSAPPIPSRRAPTYSNVIIKHPTNSYRLNQDDYANTAAYQRKNVDTKDYKEEDSDMFLAKPCVIDGSSANHLEPIIEEIDDLGDLDPPSKSRLNSESSLVATIDEIRKGTITNSPRNVYHRRENIWDFPQINSPVKTETSLKRALWKEPSKLNPSNILESLQEKENTLNEISHSKFSAPRASLLVETSDSSISNHLPQKSDITTFGNKNTRRRQKVTNLKSQNKKNNSKTEDIHDLSNKDVDFLWQLVSDNALPLQLNSTEDLTTSQITSSLQSLIQKDSVPAPFVNVASASQKSNIKKSARNKPRRKFSLLREHFEPKLEKVGDEEALYLHYENQKSPNCEPVFNVRFQNKIEKKGQNCLDSSEKSFSHYSDDLRSDEPTIIIDRSARNIKEKRSLFLKQVLSPPKFNTKTKQKS